MNVIFFSDFGIKRKFCLNVKVLLIYNALNKNEYSLDCTSRGALLQMYVRSKFTIKILSYPPSKMYSHIR